MGRFDIYRHMASGFSALKAWLASFKWVRILSSYRKRLTSGLTFFERLCKRSIQLTLLGLLTVLLVTALLYGVKMGWILYLETPVGQHFIHIFAERAEIIEDLLKQDFLTFAIELTWATLGACLLIGTICQLLYLTRYFYHSRGIIGKLCLWGIPLTAVMAHYTEPLNWYADSGLTYALAAVPTLCLFTTCLETTSELLPELGDLLRRFTLLRGVLVRGRVAQWLQRVKDLRTETLPPPSR